MPHISGFTSPSTGQSELAVSKVQSRPVFDSLLQLIRSFEPLEYMKQVKQFTTIQTSILIFASK